MPLTVPARLSPSAWDELEVLSYLLAGWQIG